MCSLLKSVFIDQYSFNRSKNNFYTKNQVNK
jgi:hypothetical protein